MSEVAAATSAAAEVSPPAGSDSQPVTQGAETSEKQPAGSSFSIPEEYAGKGWAEKIKSQDDLFKQIDNLDSLVGKRQIPGEGATDQEWDEFFGKIGKPESPDKYQLTDPEMPEGFALPDDFKSKAQKIMHESGLTQKQADTLYQKFLQEEISVAGSNQKAMAEKQKELDAQFDEVTTKLFGDKFEEVSARSQNIIKENVPQELIPHLQSLSDSDPKALAAVIALTDKMATQMSEIKKKYGAEDNLGSGGQAAASGKEEVLKKLTEAKVRAKSSDPFSPDRKAAINEIEEYRKQLQGFFQ